MEFDVNGDGILDIVSCRAYVPLLFGKTSSKLVYFDGLMNMFGQYHEEEITDGCDVNFIIEDLDDDGKFEIIYAGFFSERLSIIQSSTGRFNNPSDLSTINISTNIGRVFDLEYVDLNNDGFKELLVTNHQQRDEIIPPKLMVFIPDRNGTLPNWKWTVKDILVNIPIRNAGKKESSPGAAVTLKRTNSKGYPYIALSGDGSQEAYLLEPLDSPFEYNPFAFTNCTSTVGQIKELDIGNDTFIVVPCYNENELRFF